MYTKAKAVELLKEARRNLDIYTNEDLLVKITDFLEEAEKETPFSRLQDTGQVPNWLTESFLDSICSTWAVDRVGAVKYMKGKAKTAGENISILDAKNLIEAYIKFKEEIK